VGTTNERFFLSFPHHNYLFPSYHKFFPFFHAPLPVSLSPAARRHSRASSLSPPLSLARSLHQARRLGMQVDTVKKQGGGYNAQKMGKLDNESEELTHNKVNTEVGLALSKIRVILRSQNTSS
jgi:hypothetical protein